MNLEKINIEDALHGACRIGYWRAVRGLTLSTSLAGLLGWGLLLGVSAIIPEADINPTGAAILRQMMGFCLFLAVVAITVFIGATANHRSAILVHAKNRCAEYPGAGKLWRDEIRRLTPDAECLSDGALFPARRVKEI